MKIMDFMIKVFVVPAIHVCIIVSFLTAEQTYL